MKKSYLTYIFIFCSLVSFSQEICTNGIDDDGDGLIDLNDTDCACQAQTTAINSLIPNPSFEQIDYCPTSFSQLNAATSWIQASWPTTDYFNTCGYGAGFTVPYPNGNGMVGAIFAIGWQEYLGACLSSPMLAGTNYMLKFNIYGSRGMYDTTFHFYPPIYSPIDITLYGSANCSSLPVNTLGCPSLANPNWIILGTAHYTPVNTWGVLTIDFTPPVNINTVILGSPCNLPPDYIQQFNPQNTFFPYFLFDNLLLNKTQYFNEITISTTGNFCSNNVVLNSTLTDPASAIFYTYQWYSNGIAISGATNSTLSILTYNPSVSYTVRITDGTSCLISNSLTLNNIVPSKPLVTSPITYCQNDVATALNAIGSNLLWYTSETGGIGNTSAPIPSTATTGTYNFYVSQTCGLESPREAIIVTINPFIQPDFEPIASICYASVPPILELTSPNGIAGTWTPSTINSTVSSSYVFHPNTTACAFDQTINVNIVPPIEFTLNGGCDKGNYIINMIPTTTLDFNTISFQWFDYKSNPIGLNQQFIDITSVVNSTIEEEDFPLTYGLTITDSYGCETSKTHLIEKVYCKIPKGISPNNDNENDFFDLRGLNVTHLEIYNRYGVKVYSKDNYTIEWKGQTNSGKDLPDGTYYYYVSFNNDTPKTGWVYINREY